jgi:hypothetical protein
MQLAGGAGRDTVSVRELMPAGRSEPTCEAEKHLLVLARAT